MPAQSFNQPAGSGIGERAGHGHQAGEQGKLGGGIGGVSGPGGKGDENRRAQANPESFGSDDRRQVEQTVASIDKPGEAQDNQGLQDTEYP